MKTKKQKELVNLYLSQFDDEINSVYLDVIMHLCALGYNPKKEKSSISFKHDLHNKQIAKMGTKAVKGKEPAPVFSLRFSACRGYSKRFGDIVENYISKYPTRVSMCISNACTYCAGEPTEHVYTHVFSDGEKMHCGAYAIEIPNITTHDISEIKNLIDAEHEYLLKYEAGVS